MRPNAQPLCHISSVSLVALDVHSRVESGGVVALLDEFSLTL